VDEASGAIRWQQPFPVKVLSGPQAANSTVVAIGSDDVARAFDAASGQLRWTLPLATPPSGSPVIVGDKVVITEDGRTEDLSQQDHRVSVHDLATGRFLGSFEPAGNSFGIDSFGAAGGRLLIPTNDALGTVVYILRLVGL
jgi:outer membrane protein assembly factor BamB